MQTNDFAWAACLTAPAAGGVAVIQIAGRHAAALVTPLLRARRPLDLQNMDPGELRVCRLVDGDEVIDDVVVAARRRLDGGMVIDLNLHGGPRVVQRVLLLLTGAGVGVVEAADMLEESWPAKSVIQQDLLATLLRARTRAVACWLIQRAGQLSVELEALVRVVERGDTLEARGQLDDLVAGWEAARYLLEGVRVVLTGKPNVGKSTLANALAGRDDAVVSDAPGTTRDWVEHPGAVDGVPFTFVDTAGARDTQDPIEREAVQRARQQAAQADVIVHLHDVSSAWDPEDPGFLQPEGPAHRPVIPVWNKSDRTPHPDQARLLERAEDAVLVSARTGAGLDSLRRRLIEAVGLVAWRDRLRSPFTRQQAVACRAALSALGGTSEPKLAMAVSYLTGMIYDDGPSPVLRGPGQSSGQAVTDGL